MLVLYERNLTCSLPTTMELAAFALEINLPKEIVKRVVRYFREVLVCCCGLT